MPRVEEPVEQSALGVLWGKSDADGSMNLLLQHLLDAAAVGELMWDRFLPPTVTGKLDDCCDGRGRAVLALLCGLHDVGKASPAFQAKAPELAARVREAGLVWRALDARSQRWHHTLAGAVVVRRALKAAGWSRDAVDWTWPLVAGHHGAVPSKGTLRHPPGRGNAQGTGPWEAVQDALVERVAAELGIDLGSVAPARSPQRAAQLALSGAIIMADWIASNECHFPGVDTPASVSIDAARRRAATAWERLGLRGGWDPTGLPVLPEPVSARFGLPARPAQADAVALAERMPAPGLLVLEAPMGEGKTEAALAAAEVLARRFGADGVFVGMPTQATSDPMFTRVRGWMRSVDPDVPVALLHGKRRFNREWRALQDQVRFDGVFDGTDEFGCEDEYGVSSPDAPDASGAVGRGGQAPAEWLLGAKRGLLTAAAVGTVDQLLHAATRTRHVMLRHAGLAGRVVVLDEVHAYDVYMSQFMFEALRWLADGGVPVILLSATLPPSLRADLVRAYLQGALQRRDLDLAAMPTVEGYPVALSACAVDGAPRFDTRVAAPWRSSLRVRVDVLDEDVDDDDPEPVVALLREALSDGGCALVVRNTVARAQQAYLAAKAAFGGDVVLLHARLTAGERADRTERVLDLLGRPGRTGGAARPHRLVVVATQLAEQSFDVDADLLVSDLGPADLLLQRAGRLHRHERPPAARPAAVRAPRVVVTGMTGGGDDPPRFPRGSAYVYGDHLLLRSAALVREGAAGGGWSVPADVPALVARAYGDEPLVPAGWSAAAQDARRAWLEDDAGRRARAEGFLLAGADALGTPTLAGLHERSTADLNDEDRVAAVVRDGEPSVEVVLVRRDERQYRTLDGRGMGPTGEAVSDEAVMERVVQATVRLPARPELTAAALDELRPLPGWTADPWLRRARALVLDERGAARLGGRLLTYDAELGLVDEPEGGRGGR